MDEDAKKTLKALIKEQEERIPQIQLESIPPDVIMIPGYIYQDNSHYIKWLEKTKRFLNNQFPDDKSVDDFEDISKKDLSPEQQTKLLAILEAFLEYPNVIRKTKPTKGAKSININNNINNTNTQSQKQSQQQAIEIFTEAIKDQLTGSQLKEIKQVVDETKGDLEKAKPKIINKLKSFGENIASNIIANIITNPTIFSQL